MALLLLYTISSIVPNDQQPLFSSVPLSLEPKRLRVERRPTAQRRASPVVTPPQPSFDKHSLAGNSLHHCKSLYMTHERSHHLQAMEKNDFYAWMIRPQPAGPSVLSSTELNVLFINKDVCVYHFIRASDIAADIKVVPVGN